jgi:hypothetical protein
MTPSESAQLNQLLSYQHAAPVLVVGFGAVPNGAIGHQMFRVFPKKPYRQRSKIASVFSAVKRKLSSRAPGRSLTTQIHQALLLGLAYNIYRLRHRFAHRGCQQSPSVANKRLTGKLTPLDATFTKNRRWRH